MRYSEGIRKDVLGFLENVLLSESAPKALQQVPTIAELANSPREHPIKETYHRSCDRCADEGGDEENARELHRRRGDHLEDHATCVRFYVDFTRP
ncbi:hypothetical protein HYDPIDRAFT_112508 [Hydnomerulius pinastri MD-312]|uniref:Uncharacterized protein n=1 Tax=Hydnomerulius pinastri MD-312 TaxID=994086 RepID=A0A0C9VZV8_9AGAM|nr:hypothetical protein HYDPIDRAFT_112508 [Hydnomerulius pinastri MD-312]